VGAVLTVLFVFAVTRWFADLFWDPPDDGLASDPIVKILDLEPGCYSLREKRAGKWLLWRKKPGAEYADPSDEIACALALDAENRELMVMAPARPGTTRKNIREVGDESLRLPARVCDADPNEGGRLWMGDAEGDGTEALYWIPPRWMQVRVGDDLVWKPTFRDGHGDPGQKRLKTTSWAWLFGIVVVIVLAHAGGRGS